MSKGYVYVLSNKSIPNQLKIGRSKHGGSVRADELTVGTGLATPYVVEWQVVARDCKSAEYQVHCALSEYRVCTRREFFACDIETAIASIISVVADQYHIEKTENRVPAIFDRWSEAQESLAKHISDQGYLQPDFDLLERVAPELFFYSDSIVNRAVEKGWLSENKLDARWRIADGRESLSKLRELLKDVVA